MRFLLAATLTVGLAWAWLTPAFQAPDEPAHVGYVQSMAENHSRPDRPHAPDYSTEMRLALEATRLRAVAGRPAAKPEWGEEAWQGWQERAQTLTRQDRADGGGSNPAAGNPPLYYAAQAAVYDVAGGSIFTRLFWMRAASVAMLLVAVWCTWALALELLGDRRLALAAGACVGLQPMVTFIAGSVNPDTLLLAGWSGALLAGTLILRRGLTAGRVAWLAVAVAVAALSKATGLALVPAGAILLAVALRRRGRRGMSLGAWRAIWVLGAAGALVGAALAAHTLSQPVNYGTALAASEPVNPRELISYIWQFYLPRLPFQTPVAGLDVYGWPAYDVWLKTGWGAFGWLEVRWPDGLYVAVAAGLVGAAAGALAAVRRARPDAALLVFYALGALALLAGLHWTEYRLVTSDSGLFAQGRYLLPLAPLVGLMVASALSLLAPARRLVGAGAVIGGLLALEIVSLGIVVGRFYA